MKDYMRMFLGSGMKAVVNTGDWYDSVFEK